MKLSNVLFGFAGCILTAASLGGCIIVDGDEPHPPGYGSVTVDVTINGSSSPWQCSSHDVDGIAIRVEDAAGYVSEHTVDCDELGLTIDGIHDGYCEVEVWLVDFYGDQMSDVVVSSADVISGLDTVVPVDFPSAWIDW